MWLLAVAPLVLVACVVVSGRMYRLHPKQNVERFFWAGSKYLQSFYKIAASENKVTLVAFVLNSCNRGLNNRTTVAAGGSDQF